MVDDVLLNKAESIERCLKRIAEEYVGHESELRTNFSRQDAIILNLQRLCESSIDAAMHIVRKEKLGIPQESREAFEMLEKHGLLNPSLSDQLNYMTRFWIVAVHDYQKLNLDVVESILKNHLDEFREYVKVILGRS
ncbi:MAG: DUF86 domain-containing protein [Gammaproteobacteria bacterium]|nr:DUF86 domain-containing protein [Gammaproteobacteria bacterium]